MSIEEISNSKAFWALEERYQEKVNKCLVQGDEIKRLLEQNQRLVEMLKEIYNYTGNDASYAVSTAKEALQAYKLLKEE